MSNRNHNEPCWGLPPEQRQPAYIPIVRAPQEGSLLLVGVNNAIEGVYTHFHLGRTVPCFGRDFGCICSTVVLARRWHGYLAAVDPVVMRLVLAEITRDAVRSSKSSFDLTFEDCRGKAFRLYRIGKRSNAPVRLEIAHADSHIAELPAPIHIREALMRIWGYRCDGQ